MDRVMLDGSIRQLPDRTETGEGCETSKGVSRPNASSQVSEGCETCETSKGVSGAARRKILAKTRKLLPLACDPDTNTEEAYDALDGVRALTAKHGLKIDHHVAFADADQDDPEVWPDEVDGYQLIKDVRYAIHRYVEMEKEQRMACALWVLHAHAHEAADCSPLLVITAPTPECGKSQLVQCLEYLVPRPFPTANATPASIFYEIRHNKPTILMDEGETFLLEKGDMQGLLNSGHKRGGFIRRRDGSYSTWAPKAIALNGHLHPTIESRAIIISMQRKHPDVTVDQLTAPKPGDADNEFVVLRRKCARWAKDNLEALRDAKPKLPSELNGRTADNWLPLLAIADACGCGNRARRVTVAITNQKLNEVSPAEELLRDLKLVFKKLGGPLASKAIVDELVSMEARPWAAYLRGSPLTTTSMAALLKDFEIVPGEIKFTSRRAHGYRVEQFANAFLRWRK